MAQCDSDQGARLREALQRAIEKNNRAQTTDALGKLRVLEPGEPRWPHRLGEALARSGRKDEAEQALVEAAKLYEKQGFVARAIAVAKLALELNPARVDLLESLDTERAQELRRETRPAAVPSAQGGLPPSAARMAQPLQPHPEAKADEVRFEDAPQSCAIEVVPSDFVPSPVLPDKDSVVEDGKLDAEKLSRMAGATLFADIPNEAVTDLAREAERIELEDRAPIFSEGAPSDALLVIVQGRAQVRRPGTAAVELQEGDVLGESALLEQGVRANDVRARGEFVALRISKAALDGLVARHPALGEVIFDLLARRLVSNALETSPLFLPFDPATRAEIARAFEVRRARPGTVLEETGKRCDGLYLVLSGVLEARTSGGATSLSHGELIGHDTLVTRAAAARTVTTSTEAVLLRLPASRFAAFVTAYPPALAHLSTL